MLKRPFKNAAYWAIGLVVFLGFLTALAPASLIKHGIKDVSGSLQYTRIEGTIWSGVVRQASINGADLGDVQFKTSPSSIFIGKLRASLTLNGRDIFGSGVVAMNIAGKLFIEDSDLRINLTNVSRRYAFMGAPIEGTASIEISDFSYSKQGCGLAEGKVWTDVLQGPARIFNSDAFDLSGPMSCENGVLKLSLSGSGGDGSASLIVAVNPDMTYSLTADALPKRREVDQALRSLGFEQGASGLTYDASGVFKGV